MHRAPHPGSTRRWSSGLALIIGLIVAGAGAGGPGAAAAGPPPTDDTAHDAGLQWNVDRIGTSQAWERSTGAGTVIAVIDSGVSLRHEDLEQQLTEGTACRGTGGDAALCQGSAEDDDGHGTHVAGVAAAATGNGTGIAGIAPDARIMPVKVLFKPCPTCQASGNAADVAAGIRWATDRGADVINLSLGSTTTSVFGPGFEEAVRYAWAGGAVPVVAAGNQFVLTADFGDAPAVVVSATDRDDGAPSYTNGVGNARWAVAAPGGEAGDTAETCSQTGAPLGVLSTYWAEGDDAAYACLSGTSMAAPHVAGAIAVLLGGGLGPAEAVDALLATAVDLGAPGRDEVFGSGRIDLAAAVERISSAPDPTLPAASPLSTPPIPGGGVSPATTAAPIDGDGVVPTPVEETSAPQPFVPDRQGTPVAVALLAATGIFGVAGAATGLKRRGLV